MKKIYVVGIDGGGTKTHAVIADGEGNVLAEYTAGPSNFQIIGVPKTARVIFGLIKQCAASAACGMDQIHSTVLGLTGAGRAADQKRMTEGLKKFAHSK
jgi:N-acetylglucosamine kinase-like BadF-type ATPase